jgi:muramidase (phage lysozyme)
MKLEHGYNGIDSNTGQKVSGAGPDDTLLILARPEEVVTTPEDHEYIYQQTGFDIVKYVANRKPQFVKASNIKFAGQGYADGGVIQRFNQGGIVGGIQNFFSNFGQRSQAKTTQGSVKPPAWHGPAPIPDYQTPEAKALLKTIRFAEHYAGRDPYSSIYGGKSAPLTKMTIQEIIDMGNSRRLPKRFGGTSAGYGSGSSATGAYQFMPFTLSDLIRRGFAKPNEMFTKEVQDRLGWQLAANRGVNVHSLRKGGLSQSIMDKIAPEWASFPYSGHGGKSYHGQPVKPANVLNQLYRQSVQKKLGGGLITKNPITSELSGLGGGGRLIKESTGFNIPGATRDRQLLPPTAVEPGESHYVFSKLATQNGAVEIAKVIESHLNPNSSAAKLGYQSKKIPIITPLPGAMSNSGNMVSTLPPITKAVGGNGGAQGLIEDNTGVFFSPVSPSSLTTRKMYHDLLGVVSAG